MPKAEHTSVIKLAQALLVLRRYGGSANYEAEWGGETEAERAEWCSLAHQIMKEAGLAPKNEHPVIAELVRTQRRHFSAALTWIEQNLPGNEGIELVARALAATNGEPRWFEREGRFHITAQWPNKKNKFLCTEKATTFDEARTEARAAFEGQWFFRIEDTETGEMQIDEGFDPVFRET